MNGKYLTLKQAADMLSVHRDTIYRWIKAGAIEAVVMPTPSGKRNYYRLHIDTVKKLLTPKQYDSRNTENQEDSGSGPGTFPVDRGSGGNTPGMEQEPAEASLPVQESNE